MQIFNEVELSKIKRVFTLLKEDSYSLLSLEATFNRGLRLIRLQVPTIDSTSIVQGHDEFIIYHGYDNGWHTNKLKLIYELMICYFPDLDHFSSPYSNKLKYAGLFQGVVFSDYMLSVQPNHYIKYGNYYVTNNKLQGF
jgi:hypothetical protein